MIRQIWDFHWNFMKKSIIIIIIRSTFLFHENDFQIYNLSWLGSNILLSILLPKFFQ